MAGPTPKPVAPTGEYGKVNEILIKVVDVGIVVLLDLDCACIEVLPQLYAIYLKAIIVKW